MKRLVGVGLLRVERACVDGIGWAGNGPPRRRAAFRGPMFIGEMRRAWRRLNVPGFAEIVLRPTPGGFRREMQQPYHSRNANKLLDPIVFLCRAERAMHKPRRLSTTNRRVVAKRHVGTRYAIRPAFHMKPRVARFVLRTLRGR